MKIREYKKYVSPIDIGNPTNLYAISTLKELGSFSTHSVKIAETSTLATDSEDICLDTFSINRSKRLYRNSPKVKIGSKKNLNKK